MQVKPLEPALNVFIVPSGLVATIDALAATAAGAAVIALAIGSLLAAVAVALPFASLSDLLCEHATRPSIASVTITLRLFDPIILSSPLANSKGIAEISALQVKG
ncbi:MAG: hypothetical protein ABIM50_04675 [Novosphingobium sp.]